MGNRLFSPLCCKLRPADARKRDGTVLAQPAHEIRTKPVARAFAGQHEELEFASCRQGRPR